ncbi:MAG: ABC transporter permease [Candidatus Bathyarchaeia archaeon]
MSLIKFKYLRKQRIAILILILTLTSMLFSITAYSFLGFYNGFTSYVGEGKGVIAIYSKAGSTPFTGIVPITAVNKIASVKGVIATSPEVIAPSMINGQSVFVRGVLPQELAQLNQITITQGSSLNLNNTDSAIIGQGAAQRLNLKTGDNILVISVLSQKYVQLQIKGIFQTSSSLNDEVLVPLYVGQWLRGLTYNEVTLIRVKIDPAQTNANQLYQVIANHTQTAKPSPSPTPTSEAQKELQALIPLTSSGINIQNIGVEESQQFMSSYLDRYGISQDTLIILSIIVLVFASGTATCAMALFIRQHSSDIDILRSIGASTKKIKIDLSLKMLVWALIATTIGTVISALLLIIFQKIGYLQVLSHTITFQLDPLIIVANIILLSLLIMINVARAELKQ